MTCYDKFVHQIPRQGSAGSDTCEIPFLLKDGSVRHDDGMDVQIQSEAAGTLHNERTAVFGYTAWLQGHSGDVGQHGSYTWYPAFQELAVRSTGRARIRMQNRRFSRLRILFNGDGFFEGLGGGDGAGQVGGGDGLGSAVVVDVVFDFIGVDAMDGTGGSPFGFEVCSCEGE